MKILITGVAGFIGSNLADKLLELKHKVIGLDDCSYGVVEQVPKGVEYHQMDVRSKEIYPLFKGVDYVFHLAAKSCLSDCQKEPVETCDINVTGTVNVFEAAKQAGVKKIIYAESSSLYQGTDMFPTPELELCPRNYYGTAKAAVRHFANAYKLSSDMKFTALRYFCVYGPRQDYRRTVPPIMSGFMIKLFKGESPIVYGDGKKRRDFVYVDDVNDFHLMCINNSKTDGETYNIGTGKSTSVFEMYDMVTDLLDIHIPYIKLPDLQEEAHETRADISKAKKLGWEPKIDIHTGLKEMLKYIKNEFRQGNIE